MNVKQFDNFGGKHPEIGALAKSLAHLGVTAPHSGKPFSEELLFGIGGGIGFAYFLFERNGSYPINLGTRIHTKETEHPEFFETICRRIGVSYQVQNSSSASAAASNLDRDLEANRPPIVWCDSNRLPHLGLSSSLNSHHAVVVYGVDSEANRVFISDRCAGPVTLTQEQFRASRDSSWSPKYRAMLLRAPSEARDLGTTIEDGIRDCVDQMNNGLGITNFGLAGMEKWATVLTSLREKKSWLKVFPPSAALFDSLFSLFTQIRLSASGSAHRGLYAGFLDEAADVIDKPELKHAANLFRHSERMWSDLADAHLPVSVPQFAELRRVSLQRERLFEEKGIEAFDEIQKLKSRADRIVAEVQKQFPLDATATKALLADLRLRILRLKEHETEAVRALQDAVGLAPKQHQEAMAAVHHFSGS